MRVSRIQAAENRQTVINVASRLFRERGFDGIGLKDLMKGAGLTQGAFYKQFASKDDLAAQASRRALESASSRWSAAAAANPQDPLGAVTAFYLSMEHGAERMDGCPVVALGSDAARQGPDVADRGTPRGDPRARGAGGRRAAARTARRDVAAAVPVAAAGMGGGPRRTAACAARRGP